MPPRRGIQVTATGVNGVPVIRTGLFISHMRSSVAGTAERRQVSSPARAKTPLAGLGAHFTHVIVTLALWKRRSMGVRQYNCWAMRFPQSHTGVYDSPQFGLFVEINESSACFVSCEDGGGASRRKHYDFCCLFLEALHFKRFVWIHQFTLLHNAKMF